MSIDDLPPDHPFRDKIGKTPTQAEQSVPTKVKVPKANDGNGWRIPSIFKKNKKLICTLEPMELDAMKYSLKRGTYWDWANAIAYKYNLSRIEFEVNDKGELYYTDYEEPKKE